MKERICISTWHQECLVSEAGQNYFAIRQWFPNCEARPNGLGGVKDIVGKVIQ
jgi:hypothetical protein